MNITVDKQPECTAVLSAEVPAERVSKERKGIVKAYSAQAKIPGFRPGKTPMSVIEKRLNEGEMAIPSIPAVVLTDLSKK